MFKHVNNYPIFEGRDLKIIKLSFSRSRFNKRNTNNSKGARFFELGESVKVASHFHIAKKLTNTDSRIRENIVVEKSVARFS